MKSRILLIAVALTGFMSAHAIAADAVARKDIKYDEAKFNSCKAMQQADRESNTGCIAVMKQARVPMADVETMHTCEVHQSDGQESPACKAMIKKYPRLVEGHGESMAHDQ